MDTRQKQIVERFLRKSVVTNAEAIEFFKSTKLANVFIDVIFDNIRYTHKNLPYLVSNQLQNTDTPTLYRSLRNNLIFPVLRKYSFYSPTMILELVKRICSYVDRYYGNHNTNTQPSCIIHDLQNIVFSQRTKYADILEDLELHRLEQEVWLDS